MNELDILKKRVADLEYKLGLFSKIDGFLLERGYTQVKSGKLGFYSAIPILKPGPPTGLQDTSGSSGITMTTGHRFNGNVGTTYYSVGDIVYWLKQIGLFT